MVTFKSTGLENTEETLKIAVAYAKEQGFEFKTLDNLSYW